MQVKGLKVGRRPTNANADQNRKRDDNEIEFERVGKGRLRHFVVHHKHLFVFVCSCRFVSPFALFLPTLRLFHSSLLSLPTLVLFLLTPISPLSLLGRFCIPAPL